LNDNETSYRGCSSGRSLKNFGLAGREQTAGTKMSICTLVQKQLKSGKASGVPEKLSAQVQREKDVVGRVVRREVRR